MKRCDSVYIYFFPTEIVAIELLDYIHIWIEDKVEAVEAGFVEGTRVEKTHLRLERNAAVRSAFFAQYPTTTCDCCGRDTAAEFPWVDRVLDIHHVLPLCSGTRSSKQGTVLKDLIALCPTCHRAVHKFYAGWLKDEGRKDFIDAQEARAVYDLAKKSRRNA